MAPHASPPVEWSEERNLRWKQVLPGKGHSTPVIWGDRIFLTAARAVGDPVDPHAGHRHGHHDNLAKVRRHELVVLALQRDDGRVLWQRTVRERVPHEGGHLTASYASNSPVTDGQRVYAFFGSGGLFCLDIDGNPVWELDLGEMHTRHGHGEGASPALFGDTVIVNWDHEGPSFVVAVDAQTGAQRWKVDQDEVTSWSTPLVVEHEGRAQVILSAAKRIRSYDLDTGEVIWECGGLSQNVVASPVSAGGILYAGSSYDTRAMLAIRLDGARGDITSSEHVLWTRDRHTPYVPSPLLYEGRLYYLKHYQGILTCLRAESGEALYGPVRLPGIHNAYASPVAASGRIYVAAMDGTTVVLRHGDTPEVLATNRLEDRFSASPALVDSEIYLRGEQYLYCISEE